VLWLQLWKKIERIVLKLVKLEKEAKRLQVNPVKSVMRSERFFSGLLWIKVVNCAKSTGFVSFSSLFSSTFLVFETNSICVLNLSNESIETRLSELEMLVELSPRISYT